MQPLNFFYEKSRENDSFKIQFKPLWSCPWHESIHLRIKSKNNGAFLLRNAQKAKIYI